MIDCRAFFQLVFQQLIVLRRHRLIAGLGDPPRRLDIAIGTGAAQEIIHAGERRAWKDFLGGIAEVHRVKGDSLVGLGEHLLLKGCSLQERDTVLLPLFVRRRREFVERDIGELGLLLGLLQNGLQVEFRLCLCLCFITHIHFPL